MDLCTSVTYTNWRKIGISSTDDTKYITPHRSYILPTTFDQDQKITAPPTIVPSHLFLKKADAAKGTSQGPSFRLDFQNEFQQTARFGVMISAWKGAGLRLGNQACP